jgi:hypothetical protein
MRTAVRLLAHTRRLNGSSDTFWSLGGVLCIEKPLSVPRKPRSNKARTPSRFVVVFHGRQRRVYLDMRDPTRHVAYIGRLADSGERIMIDMLPA